MTTSEPGNRERRPRPRPAGARAADALLAIPGGPTTTPRSTREHGVYRSAFGRTPCALPGLWSASSLKPRYGCVAPRPTTTARPTTPRPRDRSRRRGYPPRPHKGVYRRYHATTAAVYRGLSGRIGPCGISVGVPDATDSRSHPRPRTSVGFRGIPECDLARRAAATLRGLRLRFTRSTRPRAPFDVHDGAAAP